MNDLSLRTQNALDRAVGFKTVSVTELDDEQKKVLKDTVAKDATDAELSYFLNVALAHNLNPFNKEVWFIKYAGKATIQTGRDGFLQLAKRDPMFDHIRSAEVRAKDHFVLDPVSGDVEHRITNAAERGDIIGAYAIITRKDGVKIAKFVKWDEYAGTSEIWKKNRSAMICKCAESILCKQFANVTGIQAHEAMPTEGLSMDASPEATEERASIKQRLIDQINACKTVDEVDAFSRESSATVGQLFESERAEVKAAATNRRKELRDEKVIDVPATTEEALAKGPKAKKEPKAEEPKTEANGEAQQESIPLAA